MESWIDVRAIAYGVLEKFKTGFQEMGYLPPTGLVLEPTGAIAAIELDLSDKEAKKRSMQALGQLAREVKALAVFTIADSEYRVFPPGEKETPQPIEDAERAESLRPDGKPRACICMEIKVEGQTPTIVMVPYRKDMLGKIEFGATEEAPLDFMGPEPPRGDEDEGPKD